MQLFQKIKTFVWMACLVVGLMWSSVTLARPQVPHNIKLTDITTRSLEISWRNVPLSDAPEFKYYKLLVKKSGTVVDTIRFKKKLSRSTVGLTIHQLRPNTRYHLWLKTVTTHGSSAWAKQTVQTESTTSTITHPQVIDMEQHINIASEQANLSKLLGAMSAWDIDRIVTMAPPSPLEGINMSLRSSQQREFVAPASDQFSVLFGGIELNPILHGLGGEAEFTEAAVFPNGTTTDVTEALSITAAMADDAETWKETFKNRAREAAASGDYLGFGELAGLHDSLYSGHPYITAALDQELMLWLSDLAAENDMFLVVHAEPTTEKIAQLESLLDHNTQAKIIWTHPGWYDTGNATTQQYRQLLKDHANLYYSIKLPTPAEYTSSYPLTRHYRLRPAWEDLLTTYSDRIMIGSDSKPWNVHNAKLKKEYKINFEPILLLLDQLPKRVNRDLAYRTAQTLLGE